MYGKQYALLAALCALSISPLCPGGMKKQPVEPRRSIRMGTIKGGNWDGRTVEIWKDNGELWATVKPPKGMMGLSAPMKVTEVGSNMRIAPTMKIFTVAEDNTGKIFRYTYEEHSPSQEMMQEGTIVKTGKTNRAWANKHVAFHIDRDGKLKATVYTDKTKKEVSGLNIYITKKCALTDTEIPEEKVKTMGAVGGETEWFSYKAQDGQAFTCVFKTISK